MVVEAAPSAPFMITKAEFLLELLIVALDPPPQLGKIDQAIKRDVLRQSGKPILGRLGFSWRPLDQQPLFWARLGQQGIAMPHGSSPWAEAHGRTRCRAKRDDSQSALPSRQVVVCHASAGRLKASALAVTGWCSSSRCSRVWGRPRRDRVCGSKGAAPAGQTEVVAPIPAA